MTKFKDRIPASVDVDEKELKNLVKLRNKAIKNKDKQLIYHGYPMLIEYAYYSILYVANYFGLKVVQPKTYANLLAETEITKLVKIKKYF